MVVRSAAWLVDLWAVSMDASPAVLMVAWWVVPRVVRRAAS